MNTASHIRGEPHERSKAVEGELLLLLSGEDGGIRSVAAASDPSSDSRKSFLLLVDKDMAVTSYILQVYFVTQIERPML
jgi:hypothetical protein